MTPERWQQIKALFHAAVELKPSARAEFLLANCGDDEALRGEVARLLAADEGQANFLESSPLRVVAETTSLTGRRIGAYKIIREIGRGGMGTVWEAVRDDDEFAQRVALKIIRRGMDTEEMLRRFRTERQILARLDHPHIARLLNGGSTEDGLPWYAMDLIAGRDIASHIRAHQLSVSERLRLFLQVCAAVQYAHQHLIIHRDLKPSNILVTDDGAARLLDFGIAKLLAPATDHTMTATAHALMTPAYASPEQVRGGDITTATDVYALGVILYELLTGQLPYDLTGQRADEIPGIICETEPERPSAAVARQRPDSGPDANAEPARLKLQRSLRGDLDNIVLHALRKEPQRRYNSVEQFAEDIRRHLDGRPVLARPDTLGYRTTKFITRNKLALAASALIFLALLGGIIATTWQARVARNQRRLAERRFNEVRQLANAFVFKYHDAIARLPGSTGLREMLVSDATAYLDNLARDADADPELQHELALAFLKLGDAQGQQWAANTGDTAGALRSYRKAVALCEEMSKETGLSAEQRRRAENDLRQAYRSLGSLLPRVGQREEGLEYLQKCLAISERLFAGATQNHAGQLELSREYVEYGDLRPTIRMRLEMYGKAMETAERALADRPDEVEVMRAIIRISQRIGMNHIWLGEAQEEDDESAAAQAEYLAALPHNQRVRELTAKLVATDPQNPDYERIRIAALTNLAISLRAVGRPEEALRLIRQALAAQEALVYSDQKNKEAVIDLAEILTETGRAHARLNRYSEAERFYQTSLKLLETMERRDPHNTLVSSYIVINQLMLGRAMLDQGQPESALPYFSKTGKHSFRARCYLKLAAQTRLPEQRRRHLESAQAAWQQALRELEAAPDSRLEPSARQRRQTRLMKQIAECEAALRTEKPTVSHE
jgi:non-specific serine/threonine protein kinase/serine/threonine-protein kinase